MKNYRRFYFTTKEEMDEFIKVNCNEKKLFRFVDYDINYDNNCKFILTVC